MIIRSVLKYLVTGSRTGSFSSFSSREIFGASELCDEKELNSETFCELSELCEKSFPASSFSARQFSFRTFFFRTSGDGVNKLVFSTVLAFRSSCVLKKVLFLLLCSLRFPNLETLLRLLGRGETFSLFWSAFEDLGKKSEISAESCLIKNRVRTVAKNTHF